MLVSTGEGINSLIRKKLIKTRDGIDPINLWIHSGHKLAKKGKEKLAR